MFGEAIINVLTPSEKFGCSASEREKQLPQYFRSHILRKGLSNSSGAEPDSTSPHKATPTDQVPPQAHKVPPRHEPPPPAWRPAEALASWGSGHGKPAGWGGAGRGGRPRRRAGAGGRSDRPEGGIGGREEGAGPELLGRSGRAAMSDSEKLNLDSIIGRLLEGWLGCGRSASAAP